jgi:hypothetical protein
MALIDAFLVLSENQSAATSADTTNTLDFGGARELSNNYHGAGYVNIRCVEAVAGTSLTFQLKDSADNATFAAVGDVVTLTGMKAGEVKTIKLPPTKRYVKGAFTATTVTGGKFTVYVGQPEA